MSSDSLIQQVLNGDAKAERALYDEHVDRVFRLAHRFCGEEVQARDLTQSAFIRVFDRLHQYRGQAALSTWIHQVAFSVIHSELRRGSARARLTVPFDSASATDATSHSPDPRLHERLRQAIDALPQQQRAVFLMHDLEGYTHREIGEILGIAEGTSKAHTHRARAALRVALPEYAEEVS